jgi:2-polyprenyl-3-methyl-5-hydroxy-6-metoxy-1,4-benzoquinol methylase
VPQTKYALGDHADGFCREFLGVAELDSIDYSAYEGATIMHDPNRPLPDELRGKFDAIIECGTLEHVFNFPVAIGNLMEMLKVGGYLFMTTVGNNLFGHGFYQFSAEIMYRIFTIEVTSIELTAESGVR